MSEQTILGFDTSGPWCAATLMHNGKTTARVEEMARGQAERLMPLLEEVLAEGGVAWRDLNRIGVGVGPGNFTGIRISVSAARGLALGLGIPAIGVDSFDAILAQAPHTCAPCVPAPRGQAYLRDPSSGAPYLAGADEMLDVMQDVALLTPKADTIATGVARVARTRTATTPPAPLYIRAADAAPSRDAPPRILDDA